MTAPYPSRFSFAAFAMLLVALGATSTTRAPNSNARTGAIAATAAAEKSLDERQCQRITQPAERWIGPRSAEFEFHFHGTGKTKKQERPEVVSRSDRKATGADTASR